jgi:hypothetical protein
MKIPPGLARSSLCLATVGLSLGVFQACQSTGHPPSNANYVFDFHYEQKPSPLQVDDAQRLLAILRKHHVRGELRLNGIPVSPPDPSSSKKKKTGLAMAYTGEGGGTSGSSKTQVSGNLEANKKKDMEGALKEFARSL